MRAITRALVLCLAALPVAASAMWVSNSDDDIFTGGKKATIIATVNDYNTEQAFIFDCTKDELSFSYVENSTDLGKTKIPVDT